ncbi:zinc-binding dehydrogenase [Meridianimarinicoccus sp. RP-17]|uniref:zinc-binding dehydrogenase n=1 Tax=Meridianimarinicoccus zhengii TaxID=2056810 RepID=UPI000DAC18E6|nr:zinc-binding dehydrogenase [Phycocomes zhengii]
MTKQPSVSRAAVLREFGAPLVIEDVPIPDRIEPGAILVKTDACSICGTDVHLAAGSLALKVNLPVIIGHEMTGRIVAFGEGANRDSIGQHLKTGDRLLWTHTACGHCFYCTVARTPTLCDNRRAYMYETMAEYPYLLGGFSEYGYVLPESGRIKVPDNVHEETASLCSCAFRSVMNAFNNLGEIDAHETVVIQGVGPLGLLAIAVARVRGARSVVAIGAPDGRLDLAGELGADHVISIDRTTPAERLDEVRRLTDGRGADIVMEFTGYPPAFNEGLDIARKGARYCIVGQLGEGEVTIKPSTIVKKNINVIGAFSGDAKSYWQALQFAAQHQAQLPISRILTGRYALDDVNVALERMRRQEEIKPVITFSN